MVRSTEIGRTLLRRLQTGLVTRKNRIEIAKSMRSEGVPADESLRGGFAETASVFFRRDPTAKAHVRWLN